MKLKTMSKNKKIIIIAVCIVLVLAISAAAVWFFTSRGPKEPTLRETVESRTAAYEQDLADSIGSMDSSRAVTKYLLNWAENKGISASSDYAGNVVYSIKATEGLENEPPVVIALGYDYNCMESYMHSIACAFTTAKNDMPHGSYKIIFINEEAGSMYGAETLSKKHFTDDTRVFYLNDTPSSCISLNTGGLSEYTLSKKISYDRSEFTKAYRITVSGIPACRVGAESASLPNPIKTLGSLLARFKSGSMLFELAEIKGGVDSDITPASAEMTILVSEDMAPRLESTLDSVIEKFNDKNSQDVPGIEYTYEALEKAPDKVISLEDTESLVSLLYTAESGVYYRDNQGHISAVVNIGSISVSGSKLYIRASAASFDDELLAEISEAYDTIGALTSMDFDMEESAEPFTAGEAGKELAAVFTAAYNDYKTTELPSAGMPGWLPCGAISDKNPQMPVIALGVTAKTADNFAGGLITLLMGPAE